MSDSWKTVSRESPSDTNIVATCIDPRTQRARLAIQSDGSSPFDDRHRGRIELWEWSVDRWSKTHGGLFSTRDGEPRGSTLLLFSQSDTSSLRVALGCDGGVLRVIDPERPLEERRYSHPAIAARAVHSWAVEDVRAGHVWIVVCDNDESSVFRWTERSLEFVAKGPYFVRCALDESSSTLVGQTVSDESYFFDARAVCWTRDATADDALDAIAWDPVRAALVALRVVSDERMDVVVRDQRRWSLVEPMIWAETYRNQTSLVLDRASNTLLAFGGQDFAKSGSPSHETLFAREGAMTQTCDPALPPSWGRINSLLGTDDGVLSFDHNTLRVHARVGEAENAWKYIGQARIDGSTYVDDRGINAAWGDDSLWIIDQEGRVARWRADGDETSLLVAANEDPGHFYAHRVALGFDGRVGELGLFKGDRARRTCWLRDQQWVFVEMPASPVTGIAAACGTPEGLYVLSRNALHLARDGAWLEVAPSPPTQSYVLRFEPKRRALVAATHEGVFVLANGAWRCACALPEGAALRTMGSGDAELAVDARRDELIVCDGRSLWSRALDRLDWSDCALPTARWTKARRRQ